MQRIAISDSFLQISQMIQVAGSGLLRSCSVHLQPIKDVPHVVAAVGAICARAPGERIEMLTKCMDDFTLRAECSCSMTTDPCSSLTWRRLVQTINERPLVPLPPLT
eukprot:COSAG02_NODE_1332_length_13211_cov_14.766397_3_plen_107_part_00